MDADPAGTNWHQIANQLPQNKNAAVWKQLNGGVSIKRSLSLCCRFRLCAGRLAPQGPCYGQLVRPRASQWLPKEPERHSALAQADC